MSRLFLLLLLGVGCFRTSYYHLEPGAPTAAPADARNREDSSWQHFFVYGWFPVERVIPAGSQCGGAEHVEEIRAQQTFVQGLVEELSTAYVNIYSPYTGRVVCAGDGADN
jgi:hypothetical protein